MDLSAAWISARTATAAIAVTFVLGLLCAKAVSMAKSVRLRIVLDGICALPLVLPPTVAGFFLLYIFGVKRPIGQFLLEFFGMKIPFSWGATVLAACVISFPLMYRSARAALDQVESNYLDAARTLGRSEAWVFFRLEFPLALPGIMSGGALAFARGLGEFGATAMIAGNIQGKTRTLPLAIYSAVAAGNMDGAYEYVWILLLISLLVVLSMGWFTHKQRHYARRGGGR